MATLGDFAVLPQQGREQAGLSSQLTPPGQDIRLETSWVSFQTESSSDFRRKMQDLPKGAESVYTNVHLSLTDPWPKEDSLWENAATEGRSKGLGHRGQEQGTLPQRLLGRCKQKLESICSNLSKSILAMILYGEMAVRNLTLLCVILDGALETFPWIFIHSNFNMNLILTMLTTLSF